MDPKSESEVQNAIETLSQKGSLLTIIIIAHRLGTIKSAQNLLYFKARNELISAAKGSRTYNEIMEKIKSLSYMNGDDDDEADSDHLHYD